MLAASVGGGGAAEVGATASGFRRLEVRCDFNVLMPREANKAFGGLPGGVRETTSVTWSISEVVPGGTVLTYAQKRLIVYR